MQTTEKQKTKGGALQNIAINLVIPVVIMTRFTEELGALNAILIAIAFPAAYGIYDLLVARRKNIFSAIGLASVLLTGSIGIFGLGQDAVAVKEASIPLIIGLAVIGTQKSGVSVMKTLFGGIMDMEKIRRSLRKKSAEVLLEKRLILSNYMLAASFFVSAALNYTLAKVIVKSPAGTKEFTQEIGTMTALSFPFIALPMTIVLIFIVYYVVRGVHVAKLKVNSNSIGLDFDGPEGI